MALCCCWRAADCEEAACLLSDGKATCCCWCVADCKGVYLGNEPSLPWFCIWYCWITLGFIAIANIVRPLLIPFPRDSNEAETDFPIVLSAFCDSFICCINCLFKSSSSFADCNNTSSRFAADNGFSRCFLLLSTILGADDIRNTRFLTRLTLLVSFVALFSCTDGSAAR